MSTGPRTQAGKLTDSQNALRHGCTASHVVLAHESMIEFECMLLRLARDFEPSTTHERFLVDTMAQARWRIARLRRFETAAFNALMGVADPDDPDTKLAQSLVGKDGDPMVKIERYTAAAERTYHKAHKELIDAQKASGKEKTNQSQVQVEPENDAEYMAFLEQATAPVTPSGGPDSHLPAASQPAAVTNTREFASSNREMRAER